MSEDAVQANDGDVEESLFGDLADAHCHPHDDEVALRALAATKCVTFCVMGTRPDDWPAVEDFVVNARAEHGKKPTPSFGLHPWFAHFFEAPSTSGRSEKDGVHNTDKVAHYAAVLKHDSRRQDEGNASRSDQNSAAFVRVEDLPEPIPANVWMRQLREKLETYPDAVLGEIGLDSAAALRTGPYSKIGVPRGSITRTFCFVDHQRAIFLAQMRLAAELQRPVSVHCVRTHGVLIEDLKLLMDEHLKSFAASGSAGPNPPTTAVMPPRVCLHSYTGSAETVNYLFKMFEKGKRGRHSKRAKTRDDWNTRTQGGEGDCSQFASPEIFFSLSTAFSGRLSARRLEEVIHAVPEQALLLETDVDSPREMDRALIGACRMVAEARGWDMATTARVTLRNYERFVRGR